MRKYVIHWKPIGNYSSQSFIEADFLTLEHGFACFKRVKNNKTKVLEIQDAFNLDRIETIRINEV